jgi:hypothetical protein
MNIIIRRETPFPWEPQCSQLMRGCFSAESAFKERRSTEPLSTNKFLYSSGLRVHSERESRLVI